MGFDTSIYSQIKPVELQNPLAQFAQVAQIQNAQNQNRLADLVFGEKQREVADTERLNSIYAGALGPDGKLDRRKLFSGVAQGGLGHKLPAIQKQFADFDKASADLDKAKADTGKINLETAISRQEKIGSVLGSLRQTPGVGPQHIAAALDGLAANGIVTPEQAAQAKAEIPQDPAQIPDYLAQHQFAAMKLADQMKYTTVDANTAANNATSRANNRDTNATHVKTTAMTNATSRANNRDTLAQAANLSLQQNLAEAKATGKEKGEAKVKAETALPATVDRAAVALKNLDDLIGKRDEAGKLLPGAKPHPGFQTAVGATLLPGARFVPGTDAADFDARLGQVKGQAFLQAFDQLKGGGQITEIEGAKGTAAINRMSTAQSEKEFVQAAKEAADIIRTGVARARKQTGATAAAAPAANVPAGTVKFLGFE